MGCRFAAWAAGVVYLFAATAAHSATIAVPAGGDLQAALDAAQPGDVIALEPNATYIGNYVLRNKGDASAYITIRSAAPDAVFPDSGVRITPAYAAQLPKIKSPNALPALQTAAGANHYRLMFLEFQANVDGLGDIIAIGAGNSTQTDLSQVPFAFILDRLYVHGDPEKGQKRGIALHSSDTTVTSSWVSDCKAIGQDSQAISGYNGPGHYVIENNHLEGAGENFMLGGSDPPIVNLVTTDVVFRYNYLSKPLAWRLPILATPVDVIAAAAPAAGSLLPGTYYYKVVARKVAGQTRYATSVASAEVSATLDAAGAVTISWTPVAGAQDYLVYGRTSNAQDVFWATTNPYFTDIGDPGSAGKPTSGTRWSVKNIFELKNAQDVTIEGNVFENLWVADQPGFPIVFTPRNQNGRAPWVVVQRVTFRNNIVRHTAGGVNILGIDSPNPSERANNIIIRNNVFDDLTASVWGVSRVFQLGAGPDAVTIDHNLMVSTQSTMYWLYGGSALAPTPITNLAITNNMSPHNSFGLNGNNFSPGLKTFNAYMLPTGTFCNNVLAGGNTNAYPSATFGCDNFFPTVVEWQGDFVNYAAGDYHLLPAGRIGMPAQPPAGPDLGPDVDVVLAETTPALSGDIRLRSGFPAVRILTTSLPNGKYGEAYYQRVLCTPGYGPCAWEVLDSSMPAGLVFDAASGVISGTPSEAATGSLTLRAYDTAWGYNDATAILPITVDPLDFMIIVPEIPAAKVGEPFRLAPTVSGAMGSVTWTIVSGDLPAGITLDAFSGLIAGTPTMWGTSSALLQAQDSSRMDRTDAKTVTITVAPAAIEIPVSALPAGVYQSRYEAVLSATGGTGSYTWSVVGGAVPSGVIVDAGGLVSGEPQRVGLFTFSVQATDGKWPGYTATATVSLEVMPTPFSVSIPPVPAGVVGSPYALTVAATGQVGSVAWSIASGQLPPGLTIDASGTISGVPTTFGVFTAVVQARDSYTAFRGVDVSVSRTAAVNVTIVIAPLPLNVTTTTLPAASIPQPYRVTLQFTGGTGNTTWTLVGGKLPDGLTLSSDGVVAGRPTVVGEFSFTVQASDVGWAGNVTTRTLSVRVRAREVVLYALDATTIAGTWRLVPDTTAAGGQRLWNPNKSAGKITEPLSNPTNYFEIAFQAETGVAYHLWIRGKADKERRINDSMMVQFSGSVDAAGVATYRIGTTSATAIGLPGCDGCRLSGWGWHDNSANMPAPAIYFEKSGAQTIRVQLQQDGFSIDQIVLSAEKYLTVAPGAARNDKTIVPR